MPFTFQRLEIPDIVLVQTRRFDDGRGYFQEAYKASDFAAFGIGEVFVQDNLSHSVYGVLRGLHYQKEPHAQGKLVTALRGRIYDVAVDIRRGSPSYGRWVGAELSVDNGCLLYVPPGFAHGFCVLSAEADVLYKVTAEYAPDDDRGIVWNDPAIGIEWPLAEPLLSSKDAGLPPLQDADNNFTWQPADGAPYPGPA
jgi:dTDP-4-dehydrorhamnose 3,5-epimerase